MRRQEDGAVATADEEARGEKVSAEELAAAKMAKMGRPLKRALTRGRQK